MALYALLPMVLAVSAGRFSDRVGVRRPMLFGTTAIAVGAALPIAFPGLPILFASAAILGTGFMLLYAILPARRVPLRAAFWGGLLAALGFEVAKYGFRLYVTKFPTYEIIYGTLAVVPLFLFWIYVSWYVILVGAAVTATLAEGGPRGRAWARTRTNVSRS